MKCKPDLHLASVKTLYRNTDMSVSIYLIILDFNPFDLKWEVGGFLQAERIIAHIDLNSGDRLNVYNYTKVYFGDYHHVKLEISGALSTCDSLQTAPYLRTLEKMAVPSAEIDSAIESLLVEFKKTSLTYLNSPDFTKKLVAASLTKKSPVVKRYSEPSLRV